MTYNDDLNFLFFSPTKIIFGTGSLKELPAELDAAGGNRAVIVTDDFLRGNTGIIEQAGNFLGKRCAGVFSDVPSDSGVHAVEDVARFAKDAGADSLVSIGGGSVIDTAKGAAILVKEGGGLRDYEGFQNLTRKIAPHIAVPTTAGTGSEVTYVAVIKDHENHRKLLFGDYHLIPDSAILDPALTATMPAGLTAATGMDAMSHAIEAMHSQQREPVADALALHAIRLLKKAIPASVAEPQNLKARGMQLVASTLAGMAFSNAQVGLVHAMAHTAGARFGIHHGLANSIFLPHCVRFNAPDAGVIYRMIADAFGIITAGKSDAEVSNVLADSLLNFSKGLGLKTRLGECGVPEGSLQELAEATLYDGAIVYNARSVFDPAEILEVYKAAF